MTAITPNERVTLAGDLRYLASRIDSWAADWYPPGLFGLVDEATTEIRRLAGLPAASAPVRERLAALAARLDGPADARAEFDVSAALRCTATDLRGLAETEHRAAFVAGLRALAAFLDKHPDVPVPPCTTSIYVPLRNADRSDEENARRVDEAAGALGVAASWRGSSTHYGSRRSFGPVVYEVGTITNAHMAAYDARNSYRDSVQVDGPAAA